MLLTHSTTAAKQMKMFSNNFLGLKILGLKVITLLPSEYKLRVDCTTSARIIPFSVWNRLAKLPKR